MRNPNIPLAFFLNNEIAGMRVSQEIIDRYAAGYRKVIENHMQLLENDRKEAQGGRWYGSENQ